MIKRVKIVQICSLGLLAATLAMITVLMVACLNIGPSMPKPKSSDPTVKLTGDPRSVGTMHGSALTEPVQFLEQQYIINFIARKDYARKVLRARNLFAQLDERWTAELEALCKASGTDPGALMLGNSFLDLGYYSLGCRQVLTVQDNGNVLHAHNLDWDSLAGMGKKWTTIFQVQGDAARLDVVYLAFPGMIGALDAINSKGIALSFNWVGYPAVDSEMPVFMKMREIAEKCDTFEAAEKEIINMPPGMPFNIGLSDAKSGQIAVYERNAAGEVKKREPANGLITADNSYQAGKNPLINKVDKAARANMPLNTPAKVQQVLRHDDVLLKENLYSVIFDYRNNKLYLAFGTRPAAKGEYRVYQLFE